MAITYPRIDIVDPLLIQSQSPPILRMRQELSRTAGGQSIGKDLGPAVWEFTWTTKPLRSQQALQLEARLHSLRGVIGTFYGWDLRRSNPLNDPGAALLSGYTPKLNTFTANTVSFKSLPPGYVLAEGDYFAYPYESGTKHTYHRILEAVTANGSGVTAAVTIQPEFRPGSAVADAVVVIGNPKALCRLKPDSLELQEVDQLHSTVSFSATEV